MGWVSKDTDGKWYLTYDPAICDGMDCDRASEHEWCDGMLEYTHGMVGHYCTSCLQALLENHLRERVAALVHLGGTIKRITPDGSVVYDIVPGSPSAD